MNFNQPDTNFGQYPGNNQKRNGGMSPMFPLLFAVMLAIGVLLGYNINPGGSSMPGAINSQDKLNYIIGLIDKEYVDDVDPEILTDKAITGLLTELDPHSVYMSAKDVQQSNEELAGKFGGVGIQFVILDDTLMVTHIVDSSPAQKKGIKRFDRILKVNNKKFAGGGISTEDVFNSLRGDVGTNVKLTLYRPSTRKTEVVSIMRGMIPVPSVECAVMLDKKTGFIRISQFGENTYADFLMEARKLKKEGMQKMILDLRDNGGGYLQAAEDIADQFLKNNTKIVFTKGQNQGRYDYMATTTGEFETIPLVILVNHNSASASEIVAGAVQDNDRGAIVGRRTFGKGLVQQQFATFKDGSALRLTIARYYTPSGRCIQRPYGAGIDYFHDGFNRYRNNEFYRPDSSIMVDSLKCYTLKKKRVVYGGGGIMPDVFVPLDTMHQSGFYSNVLEKNCINAFAFRYVERNRSLQNRYGSAEQFNAGFSLTDADWKAFLDFAVSKKVPLPTADDELRSSDWIKMLIKAEIAQLLYRRDGYYLLRMLNDYEVKKARASFWN